MEELNTPIITNSAKTTNNSIVNNNNNNNALNGHGFYGTRDVIKERIRQKARMEEELRRGAEHGAGNIGNINGLGGEYNTNTTTTTMSTGAALANTNASIATTSGTTATMESLSHAHSLMNYHYPQPHYGIGSSSISSVPSTSHITNTTSGQQQQQTMSSQSSSTQTQSTQLPTQALPSSAHPPPSLPQPTSTMAVALNDINLPNTHHAMSVMNHRFVVDRRFQLLKGLGVGAYGVVCSARDGELGCAVAIKKINRIFEKKILTKRVLREIKLLRHFRHHENIIYMREILKPLHVEFEELYVVQELMEADLHQIIKSNQPLTDAHFQYFIYQILRGLKYIHSSNVIHRDLKPGNLLVNSDCEVKICDFGLARAVSDDPEHNNGLMTEYVATRWYRAPEIMLSFRQYDKAIDVWSIGCIFAEMLGRRVLFPGKDYVHQLTLIFNVLGKPNEDQIQKLTSDRARDYVRHCPNTTKVPFQHIYPTANPLALDLLDRMLAFDPDVRITVENALAHPYLAAYHDLSDEPICEPFDFGFEMFDTKEELKVAIMDEIAQYHPALLYDRMWQQHRYSL